MNKQELRDIAKRFYLESATALRNFKPISFENLEIELRRQGYKIGKSSLQRFSKEDNWAEDLKTLTASKLNEIKTPIVSKEEINLIKSSKNLSDKTLSLLNTFINQISLKVKDGGIVQIEEAEILLKTLAITSNVHLKFLESNDEKPKVSFNDIKDKLNVIDAQVEDE